VFQSPTARRTDVKRQYHSGTKRIASEQIGTLISSALVAVCDCLTATLRRRRSARNAGIVATPPKSRTRFRAGRSGIFRIELSSALAARAAVLGEATYGLRWRKRHFRERHPFSRMESIVRPEKRISAEWWFSLCGHGSLKRGPIRITLDHKFSARLRSRRKVL
jgi:hypothetical protein